MKRLTVAVLVLGLLTPTVFAQCVEQTERRVFSGRVEIIRGTEREYQNVSAPSSFAAPVEEKDRLSVFSTWLEMVKSAERDYKTKNGRYGDLADLLRSLVFESSSSAGARGKAKANFVPKGTSIQVTVSEAGQHFRAVIGDKCVRVNADDTGLFGVEKMSVPLMIRDFQDSPEGLIFAR